MAAGNDCSGMGSSGATGESLLRCLQHLLLSPRVSQGCFSHVSPHFSPMGTTFPFLTGFPWGTAIVVASRLSCALQWLCQSRLELPVSVVQKGCKTKRYFRQLLFHSPCIHKILRFNFQAFNKIVKCHQIRYFSGGLTNYKIILQLYLFLICFYPCSFSYKRTSFVLQSDSKLQCSFS